VSGQVQREVEWADRGNRADGKAAGHADAPARGRVEIKRDYLTADSLSLLGCNSEGQHTAIDFSEGVANGFAGFCRDEPPDLLTACGDALGDLAKSRAAHVGGQLASGLESGDGGRHGRLVLLGRGVECPACR